MKDERIYQVNEVLEYLTERKEFAEFYKLNSVCIDTNYLISIMQIIHCLDQKNKMNVKIINELEETNKTLNPFNKVNLKDVKEIIIKWGE